MRRRMPITTGTAAVIRPGRNIVPGWAPATRCATGCSPPDAANPAVTRARHALLRDPGIQGLGRPDRRRSTANGSARTAAGTVQPVPDLPLRAPALLRPTPCRRRGPGRRAQRTHGPRLSHHHDGLLLGQPQAQAAGHPRGRPAGHRRRGQPRAVHQPDRLPAGSVAVPFGNCTEPSNVKAGGGPARSASNAPAAASTAPTRPTCPPSSSTSRACAPTGRPPSLWTPPSTCCQPHRRDRRVRRASPDTMRRTAHRTDPARSSRDRAGQQSCAGPAPPAPCR